MARSFFLLGCFCYFLTGFSQEKKLEYDLVFQQQIDKDGVYLSEKIPVKNLLPTPFISLSGYLPQTTFTGKLSYRIQQKEQWSTWKVFSPFKEGIAKNRVAFESELLMESIDAIQFQSTERIKESFICRLFFPGHSPVTSTLSIERNNPTLTCAQPDFCGRACWCPDNNCPPDATPVATDVTHIIVHHSAGQNTSNDFKAVVRAYWDGHVNTRGWDDIGYNWLIDANGVIYEGRGEGRLGAHFSCMNERTVGICIIGNYETTRAPAAALEALKKLIAWEAYKGKIDVEAIGYHESAQIELELISGHRDGQVSQLACSSTVCPGDSLYVELPLIRAEVAALPCMMEEEDVMTAVEDMTSRYDLTIQPNPNRGQFNLNMMATKVENAQFYIHDVLGASYLLGKERLATGENNFSFDIADYAVGMYLLTVEMEEGFMQHKILKIE